MVPGGSREVLVATGSLGFGIDLVAMGSGTLGTVFVATGSIGAEPGAVLVATGRGAVLVAIGRDLTAYGSGGNFCICLFGQNLVSHCPGLPILGDSRNRASNSLFGGATRVFSDRLARQLSEGASRGCEEQNGTKTEYYPVPHCRCLFVARLETVALLSHTKKWTAFFPLFQHQLASNNQGNYLN